MLTCCLMKEQHACLCWCCHCVCQCMGCMNSNVFLLHHVTVVLDLPQSIAQRWHQGLHLSRQLMLLTAHTLLTFT